ncbi:MAG TPA: DUF1439 domain-containing protein [Kofleriaceae bacterium]|nr:DUF1439 domain-containing protein [Kofleriaceae bacterium]
MRTIWVTAFLIALTACTTTMRISRDELQADLSKRFPKDIDKQIVRLQLSEPQIEFFPGRPDILGVRVHVDITTESGNSHVAGTANVEGALEYVEAEHAFYLRAARVKVLTLERPDGPGRAARLLDHASDAALKHAARIAIEEVLERHAIYRLDAKRSPREAKAIRHLREAHIDGHDLVLRVGM